MFRYTSQAAARDTIFASDTLARPCDEITHSRRQRCRLTPSEVMAVKAPSGGKRFDYNAVKDIKFF